MERITIEQLTFQYPGRERPALEGVDLTIEAGEFLLIFGPSGCGKTTLLRHLKPELIPYGLRQGGVRLDGEPLEETETAGRIGFVFQDPENGLVCDKVWHELVFGLESLGMDPSQMRTRAAETAAFFGMQDWFYRDVSTLSGGQKQILCLASAMILQPEVLILDEPTSRLDPVAAEEFLGALRKVHQELGTTVILTEHRLEDVLPLADRAMVMEQGQILALGEPRQLEKTLRAKKSPLHRMLPLSMRVFGAAKGSSIKDAAGEECPLTIREGRQWLSHLTETLRAEGKLPEWEAEKDGKTDAPVREGARMERVWFRYERQEKDVLKGMDLTAGAGEICSVLGGNGCGKSTALLNLAGVLKPQRGKIRREGEAALVPQEPVTLFTRKTAGLELEEMLPASSDEGRSREDLLGRTARNWGLEEVLQAHPYDLSGGEQQRLALAKVMLKDPRVLLLDEPTKGMDLLAKDAFSRRLKTLREQGTTIVIVSHDIDFCAEVSDRCGMLFDGRILSEGRPGDFFREKGFYTTSAARMSRGILPGVVTENDLLDRLGIRRIDEGNDPCAPDQEGSAGKGDFTLPSPGDRRTVPDSKLQPPDQEGSDEPSLQEFSVQNAAGSNVHTLASHGFSPSVPYEAEQQRALNRRTGLAAVMILGAIPLTIFCGIRFLDDRNYYLISLLIILETLLPFLMIFERRRPQAREMILLAVMCAIAVLGRSLFFMVPEFKPVVALVIIAGLAFGAESGFLVGAMTGFVSNFFFGQGPWTPWQMFAFGIIGFLAGLLFRGGGEFYRSRRGIAFLCLFGFLAALLIYGPLMNTCAVVTSIAYEPTRAAFQAVFLTGLPFDLIHAVTTAICLWLLAGPMLEKLRRIKRKYGLL